MSEKKVAVILGSSGVVGKHLLKELIENPTFETIITIVRTSRKEAINSPKVIEHVVKDMNDLEKEVETVVSSVSSVGPVVGFSTLGVGHGTVYMSIDQHRAIDVELNRAFAQGLKNTGRVKHLVFMSAATADVKAYAGGPGIEGLPRYNRVKGEAEEAVKAIGFDSLSIFRPAFILGNPNTGKLIEWTVPLFGFLTPKNLKSVHVEDLAKSMATRGAQDESSIDQIQLLYYPQMMQLAKG